MRGKLLFEMIEGIFDAKNKEKNEKKTIMMDKKVSRSCPYFLFSVVICYVFWCKNIGSGEKLGKKWRFLG